MRFETAIRCNIVALTLYFTLSVILSASISAQSPDLRKDAVAVWEFDQGTGDSLQDASGNGHHANIVGATWVTGSWGHALNFDRDNDWLGSGARRR